MHAAEKEVRQQLAMGPILYATFRFLAAAISLNVIQGFVLSTSLARKCAMDSTARPLRPKSPSLHTCSPTRPELKTVRWSCGRVSDGNNNIDQQHAGSAVCLRPG